MVSMENNEWVTGNVVIKIQGQPIEMQMTVPASPVKPHRMLPVFQQMANAFVGISSDAVETAGKKISCKAGCGACCRQPVPLAEIEAYQLAELVEQMPEPHRSVVRKRFADGYEHFSKLGWFANIVECAKPPHPGNPGYGPRKLAALVQEYFKQGVPCPFLEEESCSIHESRPLACREYLVTSPAENCSKPAADSIDMIPLMIKPSHSLLAIAQTESSRRLGLLPMIRALDFVGKHPEKFPEKTGEKWAADFFGELIKNQESKPTAEAMPQAMRTRPRKKRLKRR